MGAGVVGRIQVCGSHQRANKQKRSRVLIRHNFKPGGCNLQRTCCAGLVTDVIVVVLIVDVVIDCCAASVLDKRLQGVIVQLESCARTDHKGIQSSARMIKVRLEK